MTYHEHYEKRIKNLQDMVTDRDKEIAELKETLHLLKSPANAERLQSAVKSIEAGDTVKKELFE